MTEHRAGVNPGFLTRHTLSLTGLNPASGSDLVAEINALPGVDGVWLNRSKQTLKIAYDASHHNIDEMIIIVKKYGASINEGWWGRAKLGWQRQTDENLKDNAKHEAACCNKTPPGFGRKH